jgi:hypothetical protein
MRREQPEFFYVDPSTEIVGVLRGIQNTKALKVAVVLPQDPRLFRNDINLRLIASYAERDNKDVVLITTDLAVAKVAYAYGLHVYESPEMAWAPEGRVIDLDITQPLGQVVAEKTRSKRRTIRTKFGYQRMTIVFIALLAIVAIWYAFTPQVTVVVTPATRYITHEMSLPLAASDETGEGVPLHTLEVSAQVNAERAATGRKTIGVSVATGSVLLFNETDKAVTVPAGTQVSTDGGQVFLTQTTVTVPPVQAEYFMNVAVGMRAGQQEVAVQAQKSGSGGNVASGRIRLLPQGPTGLKVVNPEATYGGADRSVSYITATDIANAHKAASTALRQKAMETLLEQLGDNAYVYLAHLSVQEGKMDSSASEDQEGTQVSVRLNGKATVPYILKQDVFAQAAKVTKGSIPAGHEQFGSIQVEYLGDPQNQEILPEAVDIKAVIPVIRTLDKDTIKRQVAGLETSVAAASLLASDAIGAVTISGRERKSVPRWTPWIQVVLSKPTESYSVESVH